MITHHNLRQLQVGETVQLGDYSFWPGGPSSLNDCNASIGMVIPENCPVWYFRKVDAPSMGQRIAELEQENRNLRHQLEVKNKLEEPPQNHWDKVSKNLYKALT